MIPWQDLSIEFDKDGVPVSGEIVFSHVDDVDGTVRHFAIERILNWIKAAPPHKLPPIIECPVDPTFAMAAMTVRGIEPHRLARVTLQDILHYPIIVAHAPGFGRDMRSSASAPGGEHLIIDGSHRYCKAWLMGLKSLPAYEVEPDFWMEYLVDIPEMDDFTREQMADQAMGKTIDSRIR